MTKSRDYHLKMWRLYRENRIRYLCYDVPVIVYGLTFKHYGVSFSQNWAKIEINNIIHKIPANIWYSIEDIQIYVCDLDYHCKFGNPGIIIKIKEE